MKSGLLVYKVVGKVFLCLKLKISITSEPIGLSILGKFHIGPGMVLDYLFSDPSGFKQFFRARSR